MASNTERNPQWLPNSFHCWIDPRGPRLRRQGRRLGVDESWELYDRLILWALALQGPRWARFLCRHARWSNASPLQSKGHYEPRTLLSPAFSQCEAAAPAVSGLLITQICGLLCAGLRRTRSAHSYACNKCMRMGAECGGASRSKRPAAEAMRVSGDGLGEPFCGVRALWPVTPRRARRPCACTRCMRRSAPSAFSTAPHTADHKSG